MPDEQDKIIDAWAAERNSHIGETTVPRLGEYPISNDIYGSQINEWVTTDLIRHYADAMGDRNPLWRNADYAGGTVWKGIIAPPAFTDSILQPFKTNPDNFNPATVGRFKRFQQSPRGSRRELYLPIRPGDRFRAEQTYLGVKEVAGANGGRCFQEAYRRRHINQNNEDAAIVESRFEININGGPPEQAPSQVRRLTAAERKLIEEGYINEKRRGAATRYWEDTSVGEELKLTVGPLSAWDVAAYLSAIPGHAVGFDIEWERLQSTYRASYEDPELNWLVCPGVHHLGLVGGRRPRGFPHQIEGLLGRMVCNWMGDNAFLKVLDCRSGDEPSLGEVLKSTGTVTGKQIAAGEHLVEMEVRTENLDGTILTSGTAEVRLLSRAG